MEGGGEVTPLQKITGGYHLLMGVVERTGVTAIIAIKIKITIIR